MIKVFLAVSVACNVWFLFMLLSDRIMETKFVRFLKGISGLWQSLEMKEEKTETASVGIPADETDIIGKSIELSEEEATFDDGNTEIASRPAQVPEEKLDETFTSMPPSELEYGEDEPDDDEPDKGQASGSSFEDIDMAVRTIRKDTPSDEEMRHAGKVMTELDGTELFSRITESLTDEAMSGRLAKAMAVFVDTVNMTVTRQKDKVFVIPDKIEEFDIRDYV